ncbi:MAG: glycosyltransferase family 4 protein [Patescibacteria group bacterium]
MSKILIINSAPVNESLASIVRSLEQRGEYFYCLMTRKAYFNSEREEEKINKGFRIYLGPEPDSREKIMFFILLIPFLCLRQSLNLIYFKYYKKVDKVICVNWNEKIIITPVANLLKMRVIWAELPSINYWDKSIFLLRLYRSCAKKVKFITFLSADKFQLVEMGVDFKDIKMVSLGIDPEEMEQQENIFSSLAQREYSETNNIFTLGVVDIEHSPQIENLFKAAKKSLDIIPNLRVIVIGEKEKKEYLRWLAQKMEMENMIWLVGEQHDLRKWMKSFDVFVGLGEIPNMFELEVMLKAMSMGVPVVGLRNKGYEELIEENVTGVLVGKNDSEILAQRIIRLFQNTSLRRTLGKNAKEKVASENTKQRQIRELEKILEE